MSGYSRRPDGITILEHRELMNERTGEIQVAASIVVEGFQSPEEAANFVHRDLPKGADIARDTSRFGEQVAESSHSTRKIVVVAAASLLLGSVLTIGAGVLVGSSNESTSNQAAITPP